MKVHRSEVRWYFVKKGITVEYVEYAKDQLTKGNKFFVEECWEDVINELLSFQQLSGEQG